MYDRMIGVLIDEKQLDVYKKNVILLQKNHKKERHAKPLKMQFSYDKR